MSTPRSALAPPLVPATDEAFRQAVAHATQDLQARFGEPQEGRHRRVFFDREVNEVIKVPFEPSGIDANFQELDVQEPHLARTRLDEDSTLYGIPLLRMELVEPVVELRGLPSWVRSIDAWQVGHTKDGRLVAYDWDTR